MNKNELLSEIIEVLGTERDALMSGNLEKIEEISDTKESLLLSLKTQRTSQEDLSVVRLELERNQRLLEQSMKGIRSVAEQIDRQRQAQTTLHTYNRDGEYVCIYSNKPSKFERRA